MIASWLWMNFLVETVREMRLGSRMEQLMEWKIRSFNGRK